VTQRKYYIDKICTKWGDEKLLKNPMKKTIFITYQRTKSQKLGNPKNKRAKETYIII